METATIAGGCFWCTEAIFKRLRGVESVEPGYSGGNLDNPVYEQVSAGQTGHAESIQIKFNPKIISFEKILDVFFATHDPTTLNRQGNDVGPMYRSVIFYHDKVQKNIAEKIITLLQNSGKYKNTIVTKVEPFKNFFKAESYHKDYYERNKDSNSYCLIIIDPKIQKLIQEFKKDLKEEYLTKEI